VTEPKIVKIEIQSSAWDVKGLTHGPGLGVEYDWDYIAGHATGRTEHTL
jgi:hypothetical protein